MFWQEKDKKRQERQERQKRKKTKNTNKTQKEKKKTMWGGGQREGSSPGVITNFWSIVLDDKSSKNIYRTQMIVDIGAIFISDDLVL